MTPDFRQAWPMPSEMLPVVIIGAGGIVKDAHLPAYAKAGFPVAGIYDIDAGRAEALATEYAIPKVFGSLAEAVAEPGAVFDVATPPVAHLEALEALPQGAGVLIQKPMGLTIEHAVATRRLCEARGLKAAVNFQLRFSPMMLAVRDAIQSGYLGQVIDVEVHLNLVTPWHLFPHLEPNPRVEITSHSIHYLDLLQSLFGLPEGVFARSFSHPESNLADTRTSAILDYGPELRVTLSINHHHDFGRRFQDASFRFEGSKGFAIVKLGLLLNYPEGEADELWVGGRGEDAEQVPLVGRWFPDAFIGVMANLQRFVRGEDAVLETRVASAYNTMALVEACYEAASLPGVPVANWQGE